jgi:hypothetical protein
MRNLFLSKRIQEDGLTLVRFWLRRFLGLPLRERTGRRLPFTAFRYVGGAGSGSGGGGGGAGSGGGSHGGIMSFGGSVRVVVSVLLAGAFGTGEG